MPVQVVGLVFVFGVAFLLGRREEQRLASPARRRRWRCARRELTEEQAQLRRPERFWINVVLTVILLGAMMFMGESIPRPDVHGRHGGRAAVNYPNVDMQRDASTPTPKPR